MSWLDMTVPETELLRPLKSGSFAVSRLEEASAQAAFAFRTRIPSGREADSQFPRGRPFDV
jgi:hypothetical protein